MSVVACGRVDITASFKFGKPSISLFTSEVKASRLKILPGVHRILKKRSACLSTPACDPFHSSQSDVVR